MIRRGAASVVFVLALLPAAAQAGPPSAPPNLPPLLEQVGIQQRLNEQVPLDLEFRDEAGRAVRLGDYFGDRRPVVLVLAYFRCPMLCTQVLNGLVDSLRGVPLDAGKDFQVVVVSFDAREKPELAAAKKAAYVESYGRPGADAGWHFLTGEQPAIDALTEAVGFRYAYDAKHDQFAHGSGVMILTPRGKVARYFFGIDYKMRDAHDTSRDVRLGLVEASGGKVGSTADQLLLLCYHYDETAGTYTPAVMTIVRLAGALTLLVIGAFLVRAWRRERRGAAAAPQP
jgi:protein SCO1/2